MIIDCHAHVFSPRVREDRERFIMRDPCFAALYSRKEARLATADDLIESMDSAGIDLSVILNIGWSTPELCTETNDYILESIARYPKRLAGFCAIQPLAVEKAVAEIERCAGGGAKGVGELRPDTQGFDLASAEAMHPVAEALQRHNMVFLTHTSEPVGHVYPGKGAVTPDKLYPFLTAFPDLTVVFAHWGGGLPFYALMPEVKRAMKNVYFDTAASSYLYSPQIYGQVAQLTGADKILFGSDFPLLPQSRLIREINAAGLSDEARELVLGGNARRLLGIKS